MSQVTPLARANKNSYSTNENFILSPSFAHSSLQQSGTRANLISTRLDFMILDMLFISRDGKGG
jgi:hypothetical protein